MNTNNVNKPKTKKNSNNKQRNGKQGIPRSQPKKQNIKAEVRRALREEERARVDPDELECAKDYALALSDPFSVRTLPCDPVADAGMSLRWKIQSRGTFASGSAVHGVAYILVNPYWGFNGKEPITSTDVNYAYTGTGIHTNQPGVNGSGWVSPIDKSSVSGIKLIGFGLKVRYIGKPLNCSGTITRLRSPDNAPRGITVIEEDIFGDPRNTTETLRVGKTYFAAFAPYSSNDHEFKQLQDPAHSTTPDWTMGFYISGSAELSQFSYEVVGFYEAQSVTKYASLQTPSPLYKDSGSRVAAAAIDNDQSGVMTYAPYMLRMVKELRESFRSYSPVVATAVSGYIKSHMNSSRVEELPDIM